jgi:hypothetical protein
MRQPVIRVGPPVENSFEDHRSRPGGDIGLGSRASGDILDFWLGSANPRVVPRDKRITLQRLSQTASSQRNDLLVRYRR